MVLHLFSVNSTSLAITDRAATTVSDIEEAMQMHPIQSSVRRVCGVGHSYGGAGLLLSSLAGSVRFHNVQAPIPPQYLAVITIVLSNLITLQLFLFEPIVYPIEAMAVSAAIADSADGAETDAKIESNVLSSVTIKRRYLFPSKEVAKDYFLSRVSVCASRSDSA